MIYGSVFWFRPCAIKSCESCYRAADWKDQAQTVNIVNVVWISPLEINLKAKSVFKNKKHVAAASHYLRRARWWWKRYWIR